MIRPGVEGSDFFGADPEDDGPVNVEIGQKVVIGGISMLGGGSLSVGRGCDNGNDSALSIDFCFG